MMALLLVPCQRGKIIQILEISTCPEILVQAGQVQPGVYIPPMGFISWQLAEMETSLSPAMMHTFFERLTRAQLGVFRTALGLIRQARGQINAVPDMAPISTPLQPVLMVLSGLPVLAMKGVYIHRITLARIGLTQMSVEQTLGQRLVQMAR